MTEVQRLRELERENSGLKQLLADQMLKNKALEIALEKTPEPGATKGHCRQSAGGIVVFRASGLPVVEHQPWHTQLSAQASA